MSQTLVTELHILLAILRHISQIYTQDYNPKFLKNYFPAPSVYLILLFKLQLN